MTASNSLPPFIGNDMRLLTLDIKLWRQLWKMRLQALAIALVIISGVSVLIMSLSTYDSLSQTRANYYSHNHFADVFASVKRAPNSLKKEISEIVGIDKVETRVVSHINLDIANYHEPVSAQLISQPDNRHSLLNQIYLTSGRMLNANSRNEVIISEDFAIAHDLKIGSFIDAIINGRKKKLTIVGTAHSPEYIYQIAPGAMFPDPQSYGIMWMAQTPLASAYDMHGAFNDISVTLQKGAHTEDVIYQLDNLLAAYGSTGAYAREDQISNRFLSEELKSLKIMATLFPIIFFSVAAFLLNVVITRLIALEREQIATLKAFGYSHFTIGLHYSKLVLMIVSFGLVLGIVIGIWMGQSMAELYQTIYSLPYLHFELGAYVIIIAILVSFGVTIIGTLSAVNSAVKLTPAQGMRPPAPESYSPMLIEKLRLEKYFSQPSRMIIRQIERKPFKALLTTVGISFACGIMMVSGFQEGAINEIVDVQYNLTQREDFRSYFTEPTNQRALYSLKNLPGVEHLEGFREVNAKLKFEHYSYRTRLTGINPENNLTRLLDTNLNTIPLPEQGLVITEYLANLLGVKAGDSLTIEILEGQRPVIQAPIVSTVKEYLGVNVYLQKNYLNNLLKEGNLITGVNIKIDSQYSQSIYRELKNMPRIAGVIKRKSAINGFYETMEETILFFSFIITLLAASIAFGVIYNSLRITFSERSRELASLRVLGFHPKEIAFILFGEQALLTLIAIPIGFVLGYGLSTYMAAQFSSDLYRIPVILTSEVYAMAALVVIISSICSAALLWRNIKKLDMVAVLKAKE